MGRIRIGLFDIGAAVLVLFVLIMPGRDLHIGTAYRHTDPADLPEVLADVAQAQGQMLSHPGDGAAVEKLANLLGSRPTDQHDLAIRLAGEAALRHPDSPTRWRALLAESSVHADRIEIRAADRYAREALDACRAPGADCPDYQRVRLELYAGELDAGVEAITRGADPRADPEKFRSLMSKLHPTTTYRVHGAAPPH